MKRLAFLILFLIAAWLVARGVVKPEKIVAPAPSPLPSPAASAKPPFGLVESEDALVPLTVDGAIFRMAWTEIVNPRTMVVGVNTQLASTSAAITTANACKSLTSGGFYDTNGKPMGLLISNSAELSAWQKNQLFNGVVGYDRDEKRVMMEQGKPSKIYSWAVQAGPVLWQSGEAAPLQLKNDQSARRIVAAITDKGELFFGVVVAGDSLFGGPTLMQMKSVIAAWQVASGKVFTSVLNLDGGTASAYLSPSLKLKELKPIGSWICGK